MCKNDKTKTERYCKGVRFFFKNNIKQESAENSDRPYSERGKSRLFVEKCIIFITVGFFPPIDLIIR